MVTTTVTPTTTPTVWPDDHPLNNPPMRLVDRIAAEYPINEPDKDGRRLPMTEGAQDYCIMGGVVRYVGGGGNGDHATNWPYPTEAKIALEGLGVHVDCDQLIGVMRAHDGYWTGGKGIYSEKLERVHARPSAEVWALVDAMLTKAGYNG